MCTRAGQGGEVCTRVVYPSCSTLGTICYPWVLLPIHSWVYLTPVHCRSPYYTPGVLAVVHSNDLLGSVLRVQSG